MLTQVGEDLDCNSEYNFSPESNGEVLTKCTGSIIPICIMCPWKFWSLCVKDCLYIRRSIPVYTYQE